MLTYMKPRQTEDILKSNEARLFLESELFYKKGESKGKSVDQLWAEYHKEKQADSDGRTLEY